MHKEIKTANYIMELELGDSSLQRPFSAAGQSASEERQESAVPEDQGTGAVRVPGTFSSTEHSVILHKKAVVVYGF